MGEYVTINDVGPDSNFEKVKAYLDAFWAAKKMKETNIKQK